MYEVGLYSTWCRSGACSNESIFKDRSRAYCVMSSVHLATASTVEAQTAEEAKSLSKSESCDLIDLQMPASQNLVCRNINQFQRLMRGHDAAKMRHTYTLVWHSTATFICGGYATPDYLQVQYLYEYSSLSRSGYRY